MPPTHHIAKVIDAQPHGGQAYHQRVDAAKEPQRAENPPPLNSIVVIRRDITITGQVTIHISVLIRILGIKLIDIYGACLL